MILYMCSKTKKSKVMCNLNIVFRAIAVIGFIIAVIGIIIGYEHQIFIAAVCIVLFLISPDESKKIPGSVRNRPFNIND